MSAATNRPDPDAHLPVRAEGDPASGLAARPDPEATSEGELSDAELDRVSGG